MTKPKKDTQPKPLAQRFHLMLSEEDRIRLDAAAKDHGISRSDVFRMALRNYPVTTRRDA